MSSARRGTQSRQHARSTGNHRRSRPGLLPWVAIATLVTGLLVGASLSADTRTTLLALAGLDGGPAPGVKTGAPGSLSGFLTDPAPPAAAPFATTGTVMRDAPPAAATRDVPSSLGRASAGHPATSAAFAPTASSVLAVGPAPASTGAPARPLVLPPSSSTELLAALQDRTQATESTGPGPDAASRAAPAQPDTGVRAPETETQAQAQTQAYAQAPAHTQATVAAAPTADPDGPLDVLFQTLTAAPAADPDERADGLAERGSEIADARFAGAPDSWRGGVTGTEHGADPAAPSAPGLSHRDTPERTDQTRTAALGPGPASATGSVAPWKRHAVPAPAGHGPAVAVIIDDMGLDRPRTRRIAALEGPLTLSYLTYAGNLREQMRAARGNGHELLLHMPMEPLNPKADPGPGALRLADSPEHITRTLRENLDRGESYVGINNHMGSRFTADAAAMTLVMEELSRRGLMWVDSVTSARTKGAVTAAAMGVPWASRTVFLDNDADSASVLKQLDELERAARRHGHAIAIGHPREGTIIALQAWLPTLEHKGIRLVPVSALARTPAQAPGTLVSQHGTETRKERIP
ncbi:divergent polysaccharide deacetylase family protein [Phaeovibrio sulfidiphilus]|uniref:Divergent polysaccharide deacetylase family protein n=1 Tax=Phaeovibrio sulfidiphilus TaxID=1220600 RepID=A0A8J7CW73_9PROT|nr:divergent polysaccharide deacetylase family protein [Phaeovibrio sulfidiphilus]MBE1237141.1 divergent polysaccharide deacetylase family protein [Phaeovibrio sulfidiphilus]